MAHQLGDDDDDEDDDLSYEYAPVTGTGSIGLAGGRRARSPMVFTWLDYLCQLEFDVRGSFPAIRAHFLIFFSDGT